MPPTVTVPNTRSRRRFVKCPVCQTPTETWFARDCLSFSIHMQTVHNSVASPWPWFNRFGASAKKGESTGMEGNFISKYAPPFPFFPPICYGCTAVFATQEELNSHLDDEHGLSGILCENGVDRLACEVTNGLLMQEHSVYP